MKSFYFTLRVVILVVTIVLACTPNLHAQYPFEKWPAINYRKFTKWKVLKHTEDKADFRIFIPRFFADHSNITIKIAGDAEHDSSYVSIYKKGKLIKSFIESVRVCEFGAKPQSVFLEDVNGDGINDLKIIIPNNGCCGAYNYYAQIMYLFQDKNEKLTKISFQDLIWDYQNRPEHDLDNDHNFEIITQTFQNYGKHNYLLYNLYNFNGQKLVNVNKKADYPIMIQLLWDANYKITTKVPKAMMKRFERKLPSNYSRN